MALAHYIDVVQCLHGKLSKKNGKTIFFKRNASGKCYTRMQGPRTTQVTADELALRQKFRICVQAATARANDATYQATDQAAFRAQSKYSTYRGYLVAKAYQDYDDNSHTVVWQ